MSQSTRIATRHLAFLLFCGVGIGLSVGAITQLFEMSLHSELYDYIPVIPLVSLCILVFRSKRVFRDLNWEWRKALAFFIPGFVLLHWANRIAGLNQNDYLSFAMSGVILWVLGVFWAVYGTRSFRNAMFPLLFLIFVIPIPSPILNTLIEVLRTGSTVAAHLLFKLTGVPVYREGFSFSIPGTTVEVAKECSGIHSAIALIITTLLGGHLFLRSGWSRGILTLAVFPVTILKNGMRIATLTLLAAYVDPRFVKGAWLHKSGGIPFFAVGILLMVPVLWALVKAEKRKASEKPVISESVISDQETKSKRRLESQ